ncbi:M20 family metallopeptidase [Glaciimonas soli]|uniref:M20/M25/M40 family metallo-hydrolase n=1 Tax=Glaciimonas soli TaxID=2590999 RepID=A0A843YZ53_9BURK|nr:M20 family metallopeptidase [Glaciimonas soli]MQR02571.1 M20/M25/M40 family metallo-hydrolase [Glaciimonas soli]
MPKIEITNASLVEGITRWIECESPSHDVVALRKMAEIIIEDALNNMLDGETVSLGEETGPAIIIRQKESDPSEAGILILGHYDTVHPIGALRENPCRLEEGKLYGPGSYDMKAGLLLCLSAMGSLANRKSTALPISFLIVPDEETGSIASRALTEKMASNSRFALVAEPARANTGFCVTARKGTGQISMSVHGCAAHAGIAHEKGRSAIRELAHRIIALEAMTDYAKGTTISVGHIDGGGAVNVVPDLASLVADYRVTDVDADEDLKRKISAMRPSDPDVTIETQAVLTRPPMPRTAATGKLLEHAQRIGQQSGFVLGEAPPTGGGSDANFTAALGVPTLDGLGADGDGAHTKNEFIFVGTLVARATFWTALLKQLQ